MRSHAKYSKSYKYADRNMNAYKSYGTKGMIALTHSEHGNGKESCGAQFLAAILSQVLLTLTT